MKKNLLITFFFALLVFLPQMAEAAISFVGSAENSSVGNTDTSVDLTTITDLAQNDLVIVAGAIGDDDNVNHDVLNNSTGWTEINDLFADDGDETNLAVWYKLMGATPDTSVIIEGSTGGTDSSIAAVVMVFRGVDTTTPFDVTSTTATGINTADADPPSIDHNNPSGIWTVIAGASGHLLGGASTYTFPTGYTTNAIDRGSDDTNDITVGMGYKSSSVSDPENPGVMNHSGTDATTNSWAAFTLALRPQSTVAPTVTSNAATGVKVSSATLNGEITATGGENATSRGFAFSTNSTLVTGVSTTTESGSFGTGTFNQGVSGLLSGVTYYFRAYATNSVGTGYGTILNFITTADTTVSRKMRLFQGFKIKLIKGRIKLY